MRLDSQPLGKLGNQPRLDNPCICRIPGHDSILTETFQRPFQETGLAGKALHLAARGLGNTAGPDQHHLMDSRIMRFGHRPPDGPNDDLDIQRYTSIWVNMRFSQPADY